MCVLDSSFSVHYTSLLSCIQGAKIVRNLGLWITPSLPYTILRSRAKIHADVSPGFIEDVASLLFLVFSQFHAPEKHIQRLTYRYQDKILIYSCFSLSKLLAYHLHSSFFWIFVLFTYFILYSFPIPHLYFILFLLNTFDFF